MQHKGFRNLIADGENRIQRRHRFLKDHRDVFAANAAHLFLRQCQQIFIAIF